MEPLRAVPPGHLAGVDCVISDVDGTITDDDSLPAEAFAALHRLRRAGVTVILATAASAGWCDHMARLWPVAAVVGENGGLSIAYDRGARRTRCRFFEPAGARDGTRLGALAEAVCGAVPGTEIADDQPYRRASVAFRRPGDAAALAPLREAIARLGARSAINSLWVLGWFGDHDKLAMVRRSAAEDLGIDLDAAPERALYVGDSANDAPGFAFFPLSVGMASLVGQGLPHLPRWVTEGAGGRGFVELVEALLAAKRRP